MDSLSVRENIMLPLILDEADYEKSLHTVSEIAEKFGLKALLDKKPYALTVYFYTAFSDRIPPRKGDIPVLDYRS